MINKQVYVIGTGIGRCLEELADMVLVQFNDGLAWVDLRMERVEVVS